MTGEPPPAVPASASRRRTILHCDMDAFYVSVELRRRPELRGRPVVVGGSGERGVVAAASYEARRFGIHSAMPSVRARRLCPEAVFLPGDHALYAATSAQVHAHFAAVTPLVEPIALDEAFLDVTGATRRLGDGVAIARSLRRSISGELGLGCSVGVASSKLLAKLASEAAKPIATPQGVRPGPGVVEVRPGEELAFLHPKPVEALWGVGPATLQRLRRLGVRTVGDLAALPEVTVVGALGAALGRHLHRLAHADDPRQVEPDRPAKSIGHEETFAHDRHHPDELQADLVRMSEGVAARLRAHQLGARTVTLKVRFGDFRTITRSTTLDEPVDDGRELLRAARFLLDQVDVAPGVRLVGVGASHLVPRPARQLVLDLGGTATGRGPAPPRPDAERAGQANRTVDEIRRRFGATAIGPARLATGAGVRVARPGEQPWGPEAPEARERPGADHSPPPGGPPAHPRPGQDR